MEWSGLGDHANPNVDHILACIEITYVLCVRHNLRFIPKFIFSKNPQSKLNFSLKDGKVAVTLKFPRDFTVAFDLYVENPHILTLSLITVLRKVRHNKVEFHLKVDVNLWV